MSEPSTELRKLEGEIELIKSRKRWVGCQPEARQYLQGVIFNLLTIAKELEKERDERDLIVSNLYEEQDRLGSRVSELSDENATLKQQLDEAMKELWVLQLGFRQKGEHTVAQGLATRITEIDKL